MNRLRPDRDAATRLTGCVLFALPAAAVVAVGSGGDVELSATVLLMVTFTVSIVAPRGWLHRRRPARPDCPDCPDCGGTP